MGVEAARACLAAAPEGVRVGQLLFVTPEPAYLPLAEQAVAAALKAAGVAPDGIDHLIVTGTHARAVRAVSRSLGVPPEAVVDDLTGVIGNTGAAHAGIVAASLLDRAEPGKV